jgi:hypothetical protein
MAGLESQLSVAVASPVSAGAVDCSHATTALAGHEIRGGVVSVMVKAWVQVAKAAPLAFLKVKVIVAAPVPLQPIKRLEL